MYELKNGRRISVRAASKMFANTMFSYKGMGLSVVRPFPHLSWHLPCFALCLDLTPYTCAVTCGAAARGSSAMHCSRATPACVCVGPHSCPSTGLGQPQRVHLGCRLGQASVQQTNPATTQPDAGGHRAGCPPQRPALRTASDLAVCTCTGSSVPAGSGRMHVPAGRGGPVPCSLQLPTAAWCCRAP